MKKTIANEKERFDSTQMTQDAVFRIGLGWTGGMGSNPIFTPGDYGPMQVGGRAVYLDSDDVADLLKKNNFPGCYVGRPDVKISANISLTPMEGINSSIPPDDEGNQPRDRYYTAKINKLYGVDIKVQKCEE